MSKQFKYLFGPVPSRRLGISLGMDLVPHKTCSLNCIYCECGKTTHLTIERKEYVPTKEVTSEISEYLNLNPHLDYITFSGSGEPTLHSGIGEIVRFIKNGYPQYQIALLTNSTLLTKPEVRDEIKLVDLILPSLDAATKDVFKKLNRPHSYLSIEDITRGLIDFRKIYTGKIWLEILIIPGINDSDGEIEHLRQAVLQIQPDKVQLNTLDRPGTEAGLQSASRENLEKIAHKLNGTVEIIAKFSKHDILHTYDTDVENAILQTIKRRPCTIEDLKSSLGLETEILKKYLKSLINRKHILTESMERGIFYRLVE